MKLAFIGSTVYIAVSFSGMERIRTRFFKYF